MADGKGKFSGLTSAIQEAQGQASTGERTEARSEASASSMRGRAPGKRSNPDWRQHTVLLKRETHLEATSILRRQEDGTDISDLLQSLLEHWVKRQKNT